MISEEEANSNFTVFDLTWPGLEPTSYRTQASTVTITLPMWLIVSTDDSDNVVIHQYFITLESQW